MRLAFMAALLAGCAGGVDAGPVPRNHTVTLSGHLTDEGVECPAFRADDGTLYTLNGVATEDLAGRDRVRIRGRIAEAGFCMQGTPLIVENMVSLGENRRDK